MDFAVPEKNVKQMGLSHGMQVADLGAGSGHYTLAAAHIVGNDGRVHAIEVQKDLLKHIKERAETEGVHNIEIIWGDIEEDGGSKLRDQSMDAAILSNILFQVEDKEGTLKEAHRILKPGGRLLIVDWTGSFDGMGPEQSAVIAEGEARSLSESASFQYEKTIDAGAHHYGIVLKK